MARATATSRSVHSLLQQLSPAWRNTHRYAAVKKALAVLRGQVDQQGTGSPSPAERRALQAQVADLLALLHPAEERLQSLWQPAEEAGDSYVQISARLARLELGLEARRTLSMRHDDTETAASRTDGADDRRRSHEDTGPLAISEEALLARITEKFYGAWAFKGIALALVAAVVLAGLGTIALGGRELNLQKQLTDEYDRRKAELKDVASAQMDSVKVQSNDFTTRVGAAKEEIAQEQRRFTETLRAEAVTRVVDQLTKALDDRGSTFSLQIDAAGKAAVTASAKQLADAQNIVSGLQSRVIALSRTLDQVASAKVQADSDAAAVKAARQQAEAERTTTRVSAGELTRLRSDLDMLAKTVATLQQSVAALSHKPLQPSTAPPPAPPPPDLTEERVCAMQERLNTMRLRNGGWLDGAVGEQTRTAIRRFQANRHEAATGDTTSDQITALIGTGPWPPCEQYPNFRPTPSPASRPRNGARPGPR